MLTIIAIRGDEEPKSFVIPSMIVGEIKQPVLTKINTTVVAKLTESAGADQSNQLYIWHA